MESNREELSLFVDKRVKCQGILVKLTNSRVAGTFRRTALMQEVSVETECGPVDMGHTWLQFAGALNDVPTLTTGDKITFTARVSPYPRRMEDGT
jgi:hypothetical protein